MKRLEDLHGLLLGHITTIEATYHVARMAIELGIPGDFVECGVFAGAQSAAMARAIMDPRHYWDERRLTTIAVGDPWPPRRVHLFDSFTGIPEPGEHDHDMRNANHHAGAACCSLDQVKAYMRLWNIPDELLVYHEGLFSETVKFGLRSQAQLDAEQYPAMIAVLRLDADLYESTKTCMQYLYPLVSPGGFVIVDDWNLDGCRKAVMETVVPAPIYFRRDA